MQNAQSWLSGKLFIYQIQRSIGILKLIYRHEQYPCTWIHDMNFSLFNLWPAGQLMNQAFIHQHPTLACLVSVLRNLPNNFGHLGLLPDQAAFPGSKPKRNQTTDRDSTQHQATHLSNNQTDHWMNWFRVKTPVEPLISIINNSCLHATQVPRITPKADSYWQI